MYVCVCVCMYRYTYSYIDMYIYIERERQDGPGARLAMRLLPVVVTNVMGQAVGRRTHYNKGAGVYII